MFMHELVIANQIIKEAKRHGKVKEITVEVGDLAHLPLHDIFDALEGMVSWKIHVISKPAVVKCVCGFKGKPNILEKGHDYNLFECPKCKSVPEIIDGKDIVLKSVVVE